MSQMINPDVNPWSNGIITYLNQQYPDNLYDYIDIEASSTNFESTRDGAYALINQSYYNDSNSLRRHWCSKDENFSYFILKFPKFYVSPTFYSFESRNDNFYPKSWYIQGSIDKIKWTNITVELGEHALETNQQKTLSFQHHGTFKFIKFIQIEAEYLNHFCLSKFELFGSLIYRIPTYCSCIKFSFYLPAFFITIFL